MNLLPWLPVMTREPAAAKHAGKGCSLLALPSPTRPSSVLESFTICFGLVSTGFEYVSQVRLDLMIPLCQLLQCWDAGHEPTLLALCWKFLLYHFTCHKKSIKIFTSINFFGGESDIERRNNLHKATRLVSLGKANILAEPHGPSNSTSLSSSRKV